MSIARALPYLLLAVVLGAAGYLAGAVTDPFGPDRSSVRGELSPQEPRLRRELEQARGEAAELTGELERAQSTIDRLRTDLADTRTRIAELQERAEAAETARTAAQDRIGDLSERVAALEADAERAPDAGTAPNESDSPDDGTSLSPTPEAAGTADQAADAAASEEAAAETSDLAEPAGNGPATEESAPDERRAAGPGAQSDADQAAERTDAGAATASDNGRASNAPSSAAAADTDDAPAPSTPEPDAPPTETGAELAAIADSGPAGFEEDPRPSAQALSSITPSTRQANRLVAGVQAYQDAAYREAFLAWLPLAQAGYARAQLHLGALFLEGRGTDRSDPLAYAWLMIARDNGSQNAGPLLDRLRARMSPEDLDTAQQLLGRAREASQTAG